MLASPHEEDPVVAAWTRFRQQMGKPKAIVVVSAHQASSSDAIEVNAAAQCRAWHDFRGFPSELYQVEYNAKGSPELAARITQLLSASRSKVPVTLTQRELIDHGIWVPLVHLVPERDIPIVTIALPESATPRDFLATGHALRELRKEDILLLGTGGATHNLRMLEWHGKSSPALPEVSAFEEWLLEKLSKRDVESLVQAVDVYPGFDKLHPTIEHYTPILFAVGAALEKDHLDVVYRGVEYRALSMLAFALDQHENVH
jgi:4,5-DOPA dioxygenase extradiol